MISIETYDKFKACIIAQGDSNEQYENSGYVAVVDGKFAALTRFGHCSCYGTWTSVCGGGITSGGSDLGSPEWDWTGTVAQLVKLAKRNADPAFPAREANPKDYDYAYLVETYRQILEWDAKRKAERAARKAVRSTEFLSDNNHQPNIQ